MDGVHLRAGHDSAALGGQRDALWDSADTHAASPVSGLVVAVLFGHAHDTSFPVDPLWMAIAHGVGDALEVAAVMWLQVAWATH